MSEIICLDDSDDDIPNGSGLSYKPHSRASTSSSSSSGGQVTAQTTAAVHPVTSSANKNKRRQTSTDAMELSARNLNSQIRQEVTQPKKKKAKPMKPFCLIWVCAHGNCSRGRNWRKKDLQIVGVYPNKKDAEEAKKQVMSKHEQCGRGDILVGGRDEDEICLVIREAPMFNFDM